MIEFGSEVDILIKAKQKITIGERSYEPNQIYALFKGVYVEFTYTMTNSNIAAKRTAFVGDVDSFPSSLNIYNLPFTQKVIDLSFVYQSENKVLTALETINAANGKAYLNHTVAANLVITKDKEVLPQSSYSYNNNEIGIEDGTYTVSYDYISDGKTYDLESPFYSYFAAEIIGIGNTNKQTNKIHLVLPAIKISQAPKLQFTNEGICSTPLVCDIIYVNQPKPYMVIE